ncbi:ribonuclease H2, subunit C [Roridomyces roridus]|uniref:Ribonuclease H2, subunit C n=1 Tax=Roridomyces roridus TaxID=1738132 RepID=A0AAD7BKS9_9AGAR|nr:ribonuclease H2, subunit C [Roridomyces roridus]
MPAPILSIAPLSGSLLNATPNLMPFHVEHDGPAPIDTYFLVQAAKEDVAKPPPPVSEEDSVSEMITSTSAAPIPSSEEPSRRGAEPSTRFVATFRGRTVHGLEVEMPIGYTGLIMTGEGKQRQPATKPSAKPRGGRTTRGARRALEADADTELMDVDGENSPLGDNDQTSRALMPTAQFGSFVLWHPDIPTDPGRDEYARSLTEWIALADQIHRVEE